ncbi:MAG: TonB-dependent receptor [Gammaproteobacteria bacterium]|nr:TonB-dependent receptor [Gammaproteobacteria bacterium]
MNIDLPFGYVQSHVEWQAQSLGNLFMFRHHRLLLALLVLLTALLAAPVTEAQQGRRELQEIVVTSERRVDNLQDVPLAVTALPAAEIERRQIVSTRDLVGVVPNLVSHNNTGPGSAVVFYLRGVGNTESIATFDLPVGTYVDEVYISRQNSNQIALAGVERLEVLRGPQGTLFGRNTTGGAVSIISQKPGDELAGDLELGYGRFDRQMARGALDVPLGDTAALRVSGLFVNEDGFVQNENFDETYNGEESYGVRAALRVTPNDILEWNASIQYSELEALNIAPPGMINSMSENTRNPVTGDLHRVRINDRQCKPSGPVETWPQQGCTFNETNSLLAVSNIGLELGSGTLNLISGYYENDFLFNIDFLGNTNQPAFGGILGSNFYIANDANVEQISQELKWAGDALDGRLSYVTGAFYMNEDNRTTFADYVNLPVPNVPGLTLPTILASRTPLANSTESYALYGQMDLSISDLLTLQLGLRWTDETKDIEMQGRALNFATFGYDPLTNTELQALGIPTELNTSRITPRAALLFNFSDNVSAYASYTTGFKSGGWNVRGTAAVELQHFDEETVDSLEAGLRTELLDNRLRLNATLFHATYDDFQVPSVFPGSSTFLTLNSGNAVVQGLELDVYAVVSDSIEVFGSLGLQDGDYDELSPGAIAASIGPDLVRTPDVSGQLGFTITSEFAGQPVQFTSNINHTGSHEQLPANNPESLVGTQTTVNAQLAWTLEEQDITLILECQNCTNQVWATAPLFGSLYPSQPYRWGLRARFNF